MRKKQNNRKSLSKHCLRRGKTVTYDVWSIVVDFLDYKEIISINHTCNDLNNPISNRYWEKQCKALFNIHFLCENHFKPVDNNWKQFFIDLNNVLFGLELAWPIEHDILDDRQQHLKHLHKKQLKC